MLKIRILVLLEDYYCGGGSRVVGTRETHARFTLNIKSLPFFFLPAFTFSLKYHLLFFLERKRRKILIEKNNHFCS